MNNQNQSPEVETKIKTSKWNWIIGIFFIIAGIGGITISFISGLISLLAGIVFLPPVARKIENKYHFVLSRKIKILLIIIVLVMIGSSAPKNKVDVVVDRNVPIVVSNDTAPKTETKSPDKINPITTNVATNSVTPDAKKAAQKELDEVISLGKRAGLITSYEFSSTANVVYVSNIWYTQEVSFKKDLLAKIASLKEIITGYHRFEVRNAYSNEKVAEVTAFSGSIEVYK